MMKFAIVFLACIPVILAQTHANRCQGIPSALNVNVAGCTHMPCLVVPGGSAVTKLYFFSPRRIESLTPVVELTLPDGSVAPYPIPPDALDGCANLDFGSCPLRFFEFVIYRISVTVASDIPVSAITAKITLIDQDGRPVVCNSADIQVTSTTVE